MSSEKISDVNLSEVLFKPKHDYIETSLISNSGCPLPSEVNGHFLMGSRFRSLWYRPLNLFSWSYLGANNLDVEEALANIACSKNARTRPQCFDTVEQYGSGNWIYEFSSIAQRRAMQGMEAAEKGDMLLASHQYRMASRYFAIAAFPYLKGDVLAAQAALLGRKAYRKIFNDPSKYGHYAELSFKVGTESVTGYLHSIDNKTLQPCVVVISSYMSTATDFYRLFQDYLRKHGIAIFVLDMPGAGASANLVLDSNCSELLEAAVTHLQEKVPFIDSSAIGALGYRLGSNVVARTALLKPRLLKAIALISPQLHEFFINQKFLNTLPLFARSTLANRLNLDASGWENIVPQLQVMSLKKQGLINYSTRIQTPCLSFYLPVELQYGDDSKLVQQIFVNNIELMHKKMRVSQLAPTLFSSVTEFFAKNLK